MITEITLTDVQDFLVRHVKSSSEFDTLCNTLIGSSLNFFRGADLRRDEDTPHFTSYKFNSQKNDGEDSEWTVQFVIGIDGDAEPVVDGDGITIYEATDNVEKLAVKALDIVREGLLDGSLGGICTLRVASENILITEVGEAKDVQAIVTLRLESYSLL